MREKEDLYILACIPDVRPRREEKLTEQRLGGLNERCYAVNIEIEHTRSDVKNMSMKK